MPAEIITAVGRLVQGGVFLEKKFEMDGKTPKIDKDTGQQVEECFVAVAFDKNDPWFANEYWPVLHATAKAEFPHLFDAAGNCTHPKFAWKYQDGDGRDTNGQSVADKPGFAGHWIVKMATRYLPNCFHYGKYDPAQRIQNPEQVIKRGYFVRVALKISGNGVKPDERQAVPGMYVTPQLIELVAFGDEIIGGPDAQKAFGTAAPITALPAGASTTPKVGAAPAAPAGPTLPGNAPAGPALPGAAPAGPTLPGAAPAGPALPGAVAAGPTLPGAAVGGPTLPGGPALPGAAVQPAVPQYQMTASAMGMTREQLHGQGWTDELLIQHGHMVRVA